MNIEAIETKDLFFQAAFSIDLALFTYTENKVKILLQGKDEFREGQKIGLVGKLIHPTEDIPKVLKELSSDTFDQDEFYFKQLRAFTELGRHPLGRVITIAYYGLIPFEKVRLDPMSNAQWYDIDRIPELSYDHNKIVQVAKHRFRKGLLRHPTVFEMLPEQFILRDIINVYEHAFEQEIDAPNFRRQLRESGLLEPCGFLPSMDGRMGRRPQLFKYLRNRYETQRKEVKIGFNPIAKGPIV